jgi:hypothetical protein
MANKEQIAKTGNKGAARYEMKITDKDGNISSVYANKKFYLVQYKKLIKQNI